MSYTIIEKLEEEAAVTGEEIRELINLYYGQGVIVSAYYRRSHVVSGRNNRTWIKRPYKPARPGLLIGLRYLRNGRVTWYTDHSEWYPDKEEGSIPAFLVVTGPYTNPVYVPLDSLELNRS